MTRPTLLKILKGFAFAFGGLVAVVVLAAFIAAMLFDGEAVKTEAAQFMRTEKHRTLRIDGELHLSFWPGIGLRMTKATLHERDSDQVFAAVGRVRLSLRLLPLLRKELAVDTVELEGVSARLVRHKDGSFNFDDLLSKEKDKPALRFDVAGLHLNKGAITWVDEGAGRSIGLTEVEINAGRLANVSEGKLTLAGKLQVDKPAVAGNLRAEGHYRFDLDKKTYAMDGLSIRNTGELAGLTGAEAIVGANVLSFGPAGLEVNKLDASLKARTGTDALDLKLGVPMLTLGSGRGKADNLSFSASMSGPKRLSSVNLALAGLDLDGRYIKAGKLTLNADFRQGEDSYQARLATPLEADTTAQSLGLPQIGGELEISAASLPMKHLVMPVNGSLLADFSRPLISSNLNVRMDESKVAAKLELSRFSPPAIGFSLDIDRLNGDKFISGSGKDAGGGKVPEGGKSGEFAFPPGLDATGFVKIGSLQMAGVKADNLRLDLAVKDGHLEWSPLALSLLQNLPGAGGAATVQNKVKQAVDLPKDVGSKLKGLLGR